MFHSAKNIFVPAPVANFLVLGSKSGNDDDKGSEKKGVAAE